jgi:hypothetical protein
MFFMRAKGQIRSLFLFFTVCIAVLSSCGGGGGGGSSAVVKPDFEVTFSPASLSADLVETAKTIWTVQVTVKGQVNGDVYPVVVDKTGTINSNVYIEQLNSTSYRATFRVSNLLAPGKYVDSIKLHLCADAACLKEYSGSPWSLPYSVNVTSHTNLSSVTPIPNYHGWVSRFGSSSNSGYVPVTLDPGQFSYRWFKRVTANQFIDDLVTYDDKIFFNERDVNSFGYSALSIIAFDQLDGSTSWQETYQPDPAKSQINKEYGLNIADGLLSFMRTDPMHNGDTYFTALDPANGSTSFDHKLWDYAYAGSGAVLDGDYFYLYGSFQNQYGFGRVARADGTLDWIVNSPSYDEIIPRENWLPTMDSQYSYIFTRPTCNPVQYCDASGLNVRDKKTGEKVSFIADPNPGIADRGELVPAILTDKGVLALNGRVLNIFTPDTTSLSFYDLVDKSVKWTVTGQFIYQPVVGNGVAYDVVPFDNSQTTPSQALKVEARNLTNGELLWSLPFASKAGSFTAINDGMIITDNILLVASTENLVAIDINTREIVWTAPFGGKIALTQSGVLIVLRDADKNYSLTDTIIISAISLKN